MNEVSAESFPRLTHHRTPELEPTPSDGHYLSWPSVFFSSSQQ